MADKFRDLRIKKWMLIPALMGAVLAARAAPTVDGLYADIQTTMGDFSFQLFYDKVPRTVANFMNLAEGSVSWLDPRTNQVTTSPYYDGIIFHRVIEGFMIQCGSPKGDGSDGPGYRFSDEFDASLRHDQIGTVSMANSGADTNGGQIFITTASTPWLDDAHSVFGRIVEGMDVISNIESVEVDEMDKPLDDVAIINVEIIRNGVDAANFDPSEVDPKLPLVRPKNSRIYYSGENYVLDWDEQDNSAYWLYGTPALEIPQIWHNVKPYSVAWGSAIIDDVVAAYPSAFFKVVEVIYYE